MVILILSISINIVAMLFGPLSPLVLVSILLLIKYDSGDLISKRNRLISFLITAIIGSLCVILAYKLPYYDYYPRIVRRLCESIEVINLYFATSIVLTKLKDLT